MMSVSAIGAKLFMSKVEHTDLKTPPLEDALVDMSADASSFSITGGAVEELDRTAIGDETRRFIPGLKDSGTSSLSLFYEGAKDSAYRACLLASQDRKQRYFKLERPNGDTVEFIGFFNQFDEPFEVGQLIMVDTGIKISGEPKRTFTDV
ncbi:MAG: hypothetical protein ACRCXK_10675 [Wohlfahrtiimonas sp.]